MSFKPTVEYMQGLFNPTTNLMSAIDPDVKWMIADEKKDPLTKSGIYVSISVSSFINNATATSKHKELNSIYGFTDN